MSFGTVQIWAAWPGGLLICSHAYRECILNLWNKHKCRNLYFSNKSIKTSTFDIEVVKRSLSTLQFPLLLLSAPRITLQCPFVGGTQEPKRFLYMHPVFPAQSVELNSKTWKLKWLNNGSRKAFRWRQQMVLLCLVPALHQALIRQELKRVIYRKYFPSTLCSPSIKFYWTRL